MNSENIGDILYFIIVALISIAAAFKSKKDKKEKRTTKPIFQTPELLEDEDVDIDMDFEEDFEIHGDKTLNEQLKVFVKSQTPEQVNTEATSTFKNTEGISAIQQHLNELREKGYTKKNDIYNPELENNEKKPLFSTPDELARAVIYHEIMTPKFKQL